MRFSSSIVINFHLWQQLQMALLMKTSRKPSKFIVLTWTILKVPYNFFHNYPRISNAEYSLSRCYNSCELGKWLPVFQICTAVQGNLLKGYWQKNGRREDIEPMKKSFNLFSILSKNNLNEKIVGNCSLLYTTYLLDS